MLGIYGSHDFVGGVITCLKVGPVSYTNVYFGAFFLDLNWRDAGGLCLKQTTASANDFFDNNKNAEIADLLQPIGVIYF